MKDVKKYYDEDKREVLIIERNYDDDVLNKDEYSYTLNIYDGDVLNAEVKLYNGEDFNTGEYRKCFERNIYKDNALYYTELYMCDRDDEFIYSYEQFLFYIDSKEYHYGVRRDANGNSISKTFDAEGKENEGFGLETMKPIMIDIMTLVEKSSKLLLSSPAAQFGLELNMFESVRKYVPGMLFI